MDGIHVGGHRRTYHHRSESIAARRRKLFGVAPSAPARRRDRQRGGDHVLLHVKAVAAAVTRYDRNAETFAADGGDEIGRRRRIADLVQTEDDVVGSLRVYLRQSLFKHSAGGRYGRRLHFRIRPVLGAARGKPASVPGADHDGGENRGDEVHLRVRISGAGGLL